MPILKEERDRILRLLEARQITSLEASQLLDALEGEVVPVVIEAASPPRERMLRFQISNVRARRVHLSAILPVSLVRMGVEMSARLFPQVSNNVVQDLLERLEQGAVGRLLDVQDLEQGEHLEIFVEF